MRTPSGLRADPLWFCSLAEAADAPKLPVAVYVNTKGGVGPWPSSMVLQVRVFEAFVVEHS